MNFLPIVDRELRVAARRPGTYWLRGLFVMLVLGIGMILMFLNQRYMTPVALSHNLFVALSVLTFGFCLLAGLIFAADCLSVEKRMGTLGLLFLTDLTGFDVVLGKLAATSLHAFYGLLGVMPLLALPLLMGGVSGGEFLRLVLALIAVQFQSLGIAMWASAMSREARQALLGTLLLLLILAGLFPAIWWCNSGHFPNLDWLLLPSPGYALRTAFDFCYQTKTGPTQYWLSLSLVFLLGLAGLMLASIILSRVWHEHATTQENRGRAYKWWRERLGDREWRSELRRRELAANPYSWLALQALSCRLFTYPILWLVIPLWFGCLMFSVASRTIRGAPILFIVCLLSAYALHQVFKLLTAAEATRQVSEDRQNGNLELVLTTPLPRGRIRDGVLRAVRLNLKLARRWLAAMNAALIWAVLFFHENLEINSGRDQATFCLIFIGGWLALYTDFWALTRVGLAAALIARQHHRATLIAFGKVMVPSWLVIFLLVFFMFSGRGMRQGTMEGILIFWFGFGMLLDLIQGVRAQLVIQKWMRLPR